MRTGAPAPFLIAIMRFTARLNNLYLRFPQEAIYAYDRHMKQLERLRVQDPEAYEFYKPEDDRGDIEGISWFLRG